MAPEPTVSVIVPSYRGAARLPALFNSFAAQTEPHPDFEVIVVIDGEDDGSVAFVDAENRFEVRHILFSRNRGRVAALNAGADAARGQVLIRCDDDLVVPAEYIEVHVRAHESAQRGIGVVAPTRDVHLDSAYSRAYGEEAARRSLEHVLHQPADQRWRLWAASCSITRATWHQIGPYDPRYQGYGWEDIDYGYRLHVAGLPIVVAEDALAEHHGPARTVTARALKAYDAGGARATFQRLHPEAPLPSASAGHGAWGLVVRAAAAGMRRRSGVKLLGGVVDRVLGVVPRAVGRKLVALVVEGAGVSGQQANEETGEPNR